MAFGGAFGGIFFLALGALRLRRERVVAELPHRPRRRRRLPDRRRVDAESFAAGRAARRRVRPPASAPGMSARERIERRRARARSLPASWRSPAGPASGSPPASRASWSRRCRRRAASRCRCSPPGSARCWPSPAPRSLRHLGLVALHRHHGAGRAARSATTASADEGRLSRVHVAAAGGPAAPRAEERRQRRRPSTEGNDAAKMAGEEGKMGNKESSNPQTASYHMKNNGETPQLAKARGDRQRAHGRRARHPRRVNPHGRSRR